MIYKWGKACRVTTDGWWSWSKGKCAMRLLSNETLLESYYRAVDLKLDREFINLLLAEIERRNLKVNNTKGAWCSMRIRALRQDIIPAIHWTRPETIHGMLDIRTRVCRRNPWTPHRHGSSPDLRCPGRGNRARAYPWTFQDPGPDDRNADRWAPPYRNRCISDTVLTWWWSTPSPDSAASMPIPPLTINRMHPTFARSVPDHTAEIDHKCTAQPVPRPFVHSYKKRC